MLNRITLQGRLTAEPVLRTTNNGKPVTSFTLACDRDFNREDVDFINCTAWNSTAEFVTKYFHKGQLVIVSGRLQNRNWTDKDGNKRTTAEIVCDFVYFGEGKKQTSSPDVVYTEVTDDEPLPF